MQLQHPVSPSAWLCAGLPAQLRPDENVAALLAVDLDQQLRFQAGLLALTNRRVLAADVAGRWRSWELADVAGLRHFDHAGIGTLELQGREQRLATFRFTLGANARALQWLAAFERLRAEGAEGGAPLEPCPRCHALRPAARVSADQLAGSDAAHARKLADSSEAVDASEAADASDAAADCPFCQAPEPAPPSTWVLLRLSRFARPYRRELLAGFVLTLLATAAALVPPYLTIPLMDDVLIPFQNGRSIDPWWVGGLLGGLFGAALVAWVLSWARTWLMARVSERIAADLRTAAFEHLLRLSLDYFGGKRTGDLIARIGSETDRISVFLSLHALDFANDVLMIVMTAAILFSIDPTLALVTLLPLPFIGWMIHYVRDRLRTGFEKIDRVWAEVSNVLADTIPGIRVVKAFAQERREAQRFRDANRHNLAVNDRLNRTWSLFSPTVSLLTDVGLLVVWGCGIWLVARGQITVGVLTAFIAYIGRFYTRLDSMSRIVSVTQKAAAGAKRIFDILDHVSNVPEPAEPLPLGRMRGAIELSDVGFRYGNRAVIRGLDLAIRPGEMIGLVGHSGSGKSTLVNLICRFYDVSSGRISVDGVDIRRYALADYRRHIGLVLQEPFLFFGTVAENIAYGRPDASREAIVAAARAAHAHEFILRLPHGYDSLVGERGQGLSGGERQRISIARALLIDPRILILDEATSSVDTETEKEIQRALDNLVEGRTTIAIAHRLSTLRKADRLVVMERGRIVEVGPHDELMARHGAYRRLYEAQLRRADGALVSDEVDEAEPAEAVASAAGRAHGSIAALSLEASLADAPEASHEARTADAAGGSNLSAAPR